MRARIWEPPNSTSGDIDIELKLETPPCEDLQGLGGIDWYGMCGPD